MKNKGFTLIDSLIILGCIAFLIILVSPNIINYIKNNNDDKFYIYANNLIEEMNKYTSNHSDEFIKYPIKNNNNLLYIHKNTDEILKNKKYTGGITKFSDNTLSIDIKDKSNHRCIYLSKTTTIAKEDIKHDCK